LVQGIRIDLILWAKNLFAGPSFENEDLRFFFYFAIGRSHLREIGYMCWDQRLIHLKSRKHNIGACDGMVYGCVPF